MTATSLKISGILSMVSAVLAIPWFLVVYFVQDKDAPTLRMVEGSLLVAGMMLLVYLLSALRRLLKARYRFIRAEKVISLLITGNIVLAIVGIVGIAVPSLDYAVAMTSVVFVIPVGVIQIRLGRILLDLPGDLNGLRRPYAYLNIATGFCQAVFFLMPVALFTGALSDVMLGTIFLHEAARLESNSGHKK